MSLFRRLQRWLDDPLRGELEVARVELALTKERLHRAECAFDAKSALLDGVRQDFTDTLRLLGEMKRAGFVAETVTGSRPPVAESEEERQIWDAIWQRAPRGSGLAASLYQHAQMLLQAEQPIEQVIGSILEGGTIDLDDLEEMGV